MTTSKSYAQRPRTRSAGSPSAPGARRPGAARPGGSPADQITGADRPGPKPWQIALAVGVVVAALLGFSLLDRAPASGPTAACVIATDPQGSTGEMSGAYKAWLPAEARSCAAADRADLKLVLVTSETRTGTTIPVSTNLSDLDLTGNAVVDADLVDEEIDRAVTAAGPVIFGAPEQSPLGTDLVGLVCVAHDLLASHGSKTLIINTDAMNDRRPYKLRAIPLDPASIQRYVDELRSSGQLCDLKGTDVYVYGAEIGSGTAELSAGQLTGAHRFWTAVYQAAGANLVAYQRNP